MSSALHGKNILMLAPSFFRYEVDIKNALELLGANVSLYDERPDNTFLTKVLLRLGFRFLVEKKIRSYFARILDETSKVDFDYVFLISPETISVSIVEQLKQRNKNSKLIVYMWDSIQNKKIDQRIIELSNLFWSFEKSDLKYNPKIKFLPLFYSTLFEEYAFSDGGEVYDLSFIGTIHSDRYVIADKLKGQAEALGLRTYFYFYSPSKTLFFLQKYIFLRNKNIPTSDVSFASLDKTQVAEILRKSRAVLDIQHPQQSGLTMRTIEVLGAKKKLITTNSEIMNYDFFDNNISIIDRNNPLLDPLFFAEGHYELNPEIYKQYSLDSWIENVFGLNS